MSGAVIVMEVVTTYEVCVFINGTYKSIEQKLLEWLTQHFDTHLLRGCKLLLRQLNDMLFKSRSSRLTRN